MTLKEMSINF